VVAADEILGWIVAGSVTLGGVLAANYLAERAEKQRHHFNALKEKVFKPWSVWIGSLRQVPDMVTPVGTGYRATDGFFPISNVPECVRKAHYAELCKDWESLDLEYRQLLSQVMDFESSVETQAAQIVGGLRSRGLTYRDVAAYPSYANGLVSILVGGILAGQRHEPWSLPKVTLSRPNTLDGSVDTTKQYLELNLDGVTHAALLVDESVDPAQLEPTLKGKLGELVESAVLVKKAQIALSTESGFRVSLTAFESRLNHVLNFVQALPGMCSAVEPLWYFRLFTIAREWNHGG